MQKFADVARVEVFAALVQLAQRLDRQIPKRGEPLPPELEERGDDAARHWLETREFPADDQMARALFPRLWFANTFLQHSQVHGIPFPTGDTAPSLQALLMIEAWTAAGWQQWERTPGEVPPGG